MSRAVDEVDHKQLVPNREGGMTNNILVMDVEGTDGRERGEDQDFERKSALFALATSEVLVGPFILFYFGRRRGARYRRVGAGSLDLS